MRTQNSSQKKKTFFENVREIAGLLLVVFLIRTFGFGLYQVPTGSMETTMLVGERFFADKFTILFSRPKNNDIISFNDPLFPYSKNPVVRLWQEYVWGPSNWTKRIIGVPGDEVHGTVEDGKPVVYINGKKLDEPYLNSYPLIKVWSMDPSRSRMRCKQIAELESKGNSDLYDEIYRECANYLSGKKSYDPSCPYDRQPFYRINESRIAKDASGQPLLIQPGTLLPNIREYSQRHGKNYWNGSDEFYVKLGADEFWLMGDNRLGSKDSRFIGPVKERFIHGKIIFRIWSIDSYESWFIIDLIKNPIDFFQRVRWCRCLQPIK